MKSSISPDLIHPSLNLCAAFVTHPVLGTLPEAGSLYSDLSATIHPLNLRGLQRCNLPSICHFFHTINLKNFFGLYTTITYLQMTPNILIFSPTLYSHFQYKA